MSFLGLTACKSMTPIPLVNTVDLNRFMGDWYVIAAIPTWLEQGIYQPKESYALNMDGSIATTFTFRQGTLHGELKSYHPTGFIVPGTGNAEWQMQFIWPIKSEYLIAHVAEDYSTTIIARNKRDYVWIMARQPILQDDTYQDLVNKVKGLGYDIDKLVKFEHEKQ